MDCSKQFNVKAWFIRKRNLPGCLWHLFRGVVYQCFCSYMQHLSWDGVPELSKCSRRLEKNRILVLAVVVNVFCVLLYLQLTE